MRSILTIIRNDLRIFLGQPGNWVSVFLLPMAFTGVLGWAMGGAGADTPQVAVRVDVVVTDGSATADRFVARLRAVNDTLLLCPMDNDAQNACRLAAGQTTLAVEEGIARVQRGSTTALIVLPADFSATGEAGAPAQIDYYSLEDPTAPSPILQSAQTVVQELNGAGVAEYAGLGLIDGLADLAGEEGRMLFVDSGVRDRFAATYREALAKRSASWPQRVIFVTTEPLAEDATLQGFAQAVPGMGTLFVMLTVLSGMSILLNERRQWTLQRLAVAPVTRAQILAGKAGTYLTLGMLQFSVVFLVGALVGINLGGAPLALLAVMLAFVLCITGLTFALAPHMQNEAQANGLARLLSLTLAPLGGAWWPLAIVPPFMQVIGHLSPVAWAMDAFQELIWYGGGFGDVLLEIGVLLAAAVALFVVGVLAFRIDN